LRYRIFDVDKWADNNDRIREVHPEVSFAAMDGSPLPWSKKSADGFLRRKLLQQHGIELPPELGSGRCRWTTSTMPPRRRGARGGSC
jgi:predicted RNase H-like nuclease